MNTKFGKVSLLAFFIVILLAISQGGKEEVKAQDDISVNNQEKIVFRADVNIYSMNPDGSDITNLTQNPSTFFISEPSISPDGTQIAFTSDLEERYVYDVYIMNSDGSNQIRLGLNTSMEGGIGSLSWSPDGSKIAYILTVPADAIGEFDNNVFVANIDGSNVRQITSGINVKHKTSWSPNGDKIAFGSINDDKEQVISTVNTDGTGHIELPCSYKCAYPDWSPDGNQIAFSSRRAENPDIADIYIMDADGTNVTRVTSSSGLEYGNSWSPDGNKIVFDSLRNGEVNIYVINIDGTNETQITFGPSSKQKPDWGSISTSTALACEEIAPGMCVAEIPEGGLIAKADLTNPNVKVELAHSFADESIGLFNAHSVDTLVQRFSGAGATQYPYVGYSHPWIAINGTARSKGLLPYPYPGEDLYTNDSTLGLFNEEQGESYIYEVHCATSFEDTRCISGTDRGLFAYDPIQGASVFREYVDYTHDEDEDIWREDIATLIGANRFVLGYQQTLLDTQFPNGDVIPSFPQYVATQQRHDSEDQNDFKTLLGVSQTEVFMAAIDKDVRYEDAVRYMMDMGAERVILLDSGSPTYLGSYGKESGYQNYTGGALGTPYLNTAVINAVVVYNDQVEIPEYILYPMNGSHQVSSNTRISFTSEVFGNNVTFAYLPQSAPEIEAEGLAHTSRFFGLVATDTGGNEVQPSGSFELQVKYDESQITSGVYEGSLSLYYEDNGVWVKEPSTVDMVANTVTAYPNHLSSWAVLGVENTIVYLPVVLK